MLLFSFFLFFYFYHKILCNYSYFFIQNYHEDTTSMIFINYVGNFDLYITLVVIKTYKRRRVLLVSRKEKEGGVLIKFGIEKSAGETRMHYKRTCYRLCCY